MESILLFLQTVIGNILTYGTPLVSNFLVEYEKFLRHKDRDRMHKNCRRVKVPGCFSLRDTGVMWIKNDFFFVSQITEDKTRKFCFSLSSSVRIRKYENL